MARLTRSVLGGASPTFSPDGRRIAFVGGLPLPAAETEQRGSIRVLDLSRTHAELLVPAPSDDPYADDSTPEWSPDGQQVAFLRHQSILEVFDLRTGETRPIPGARKVHSAPAWSPDGKQIAYAQSCSLYVTSSSGGDKRRLMHRTRTCFYSPAWAPDGRSIAMLRERGKVVDILLVRSDGSVLGSILGRRGWAIASLGWSSDRRRFVFEGGPRNGNDIYVVGRDGLGLKNLTPGARRYGMEPEFAPDRRTIIYAHGAEPRLIQADGSRDRALRPTRYITSMMASPDGRQIAFTSWDFQLGSADVHVIRSDGKGERRLTSHRRNDRDPGWSPSGKRIVFLSGREGGGVFVMRARGRARAVRVGRLGFLPRFSPSGAEIAYTVPEIPDSDSPLYPQLRILNLRTHRSRPFIRGLDRQADGTASGSWSPDGRFLAYVVVNRARSEVRIARSDGTSPRRIAGTADLPVWSPDGRFIAFIRRGAIYEVELATGREQRVDTGAGQVLSFDWRPIR